MRKKLVYLGLLILWILCLTIGPSDADVIVREADIHQVVRDYVTGMVSTFGGEVEVSVRRRGDLSVKGTGAVHLEVRPFQSRSNARMIPVMLEIRRGPAVVREYPVTADVRYFDQVLVAARPISRGELITAEVVTSEKREVTSILGKYVSDLSELSGMRAKTQIAFGRPLNMHYVERIPAVKRGDTVRVRVQFGGIAASTLGVAKGQGAVGDRILVENLASREKLLAEVIGRGIVKVVF